MRGQLDKKRVRVVLYEGAGAQALEADRRHDTLLALLESGHAVTVPSTACSAVGGGVSLVDDSEHLVLGQFDDLPAETDVLRFVDIACCEAEAVKDLVDTAVSDAGAVTNPGWKPWFPVIDYKRCTHCMQCLTFCLFDVYGTDTDKQIEVRSQDNCKTDCPACSRVCPEAAIMFPKYQKGPINGDVVRDEDMQRESMKVDISALLGGDMYAQLRNRSDTAKKRFSTERDESKALLERKRCLAKVQKALDIPNEVLMTLPSVGDIEERKKRAFEKAERRKGRSQTMADSRKKGIHKATEEDWGI